MGNVVPLALNRCMNLLGPLDAERRNRLLVVVNDPTPETWGAAYSVLVTPTRTLWQAVMAVDPGCPRSRPPVRREERPPPWQYVPTAAILVLALERATARSTP